MQNKNKDRLIGLGVILSSILCKFILLDGTLIPFALIIGVPMILGQEIKVKGEERNV